MTPPTAALDLLASATTALRGRGELSWRGDFASLAPSMPLSAIGIDSIEWMGLLLELEVLGGLPLHNSELAQLGSVSDLLVLLERKQAS